MESEILTTLQEIRAYAFITMIAVVMWVFFKILESIQRIITGFKKAWDDQFNTRMLDLIQKGNYDDVITECADILNKSSNNLNANWFIARAYYHKQDSSHARNYFEKVIQLEPSWKEDAEDYLSKLG